MGDKKQFSVLIVDDSGHNLRLLTNILKADYNLYIAKNGFDAIQTAIEKQPDVILLDILMPNIDGYEVITVLKNDERTREIPVIFITALDNQDDEAKGLSLQAADYIGKPFTPAIVKLRVRNQIQILSRLREADSRAKKHMDEEDLSSASHGLSMAATPAKDTDNGLYYDPITEIYNKRFFEEYAKSVIDNLAGAQGVLSLILIDIDRLERYSDTHDQPSGDERLRRVAGALKGCIMRDGDFVARYGGGEFVAVLPGADKYGARLVARDMLHAVRALDISGDLDERVTVSIGVATGSVQHTHSRDDYLGLAGDMLRISKKDGGNRFNLAMLT